MTDEKSNAAATGIAMLIILIAAFALCQLLAGCVSVTQTRLSTLCSTRRSCLST